MHLIVSCIMLGRQDVLEKAHAFNLETMQPEPAAAASHQAAQAAVLVPLLNLPEGQQEFIAVGMRLHADLLQSIHNERQQLQLQVACDSGSSASSWDSGGGGSGGGSGSGGGDGGSSKSTSSRSSGQLDTLLLRHSQLQKQQAQTNRLNLLLHKVRRFLQVSPSYFLIGAWPARA